MPAEDWGFGDWVSDPQERYSLRKRLQMFTQEWLGLLWNGSKKILGPESKKWWNGGKKSGKAIKKFWAETGEIRARTEFVVMPYCT